MWMGSEMLSWWLYGEAGYLVQLRWWMYRVGLDETGSVRASAAFEVRPTRDSMEFERSLSER